MGYKGKEIRRLGRRWYVPKKLHKKCKLSLQLHKYRPR